MRFANDFKKFILGFALFAIALVILPLFALAADGVLPLPEADVVSLLLKLATDWKSMGALAIGAVVTLLTVQAIKAFVPEQWKFKRLITVVVSIIYSVIAGLVLPGSNIATVLVTILVTGGGASAIYEGLKGAGIIKKDPLAAIVPKAA